MLHANQPAGHEHHTATIGTHRIARELQCTCKPFRADALVLQSLSREIMRGFRTVTDAWPVF
jgi:hypothetical protein